MKITTENEEEDILSCVFWSRNIDITQCDNIYFLTK
jgi:hypothetical protein